MVFLVLRQTNTVCRFTENINSTHSVSFKSYSWVFVFKLFNGNILGTLAIEASELY